MQKSVLFCAKSAPAVSDLVWQKVDSVQTAKVSFTGNNNFAVTLPGVPTDATYVLGDIFTSVGADDHLVFNFGPEEVAVGTEWVSPGSDPNSAWGTFAATDNHLSINNPGQSDGYTPTYGVWYSSQHIPVKNGQTNFRTNGASSTTAGYVWVRVRAYSVPGTDARAGLSYKEVDASFVEWQFSSYQTGSKTMPDTVPTDAEYVLCDFFVSQNTDDHQNFAFSDEAVGAEQNWVSNRGDNPEGQINAKTQTRQEVTLTHNGQNDGYSPYYGSWWSSHLVPVQSRTFYWGNYGVCVFACSVGRMSSISDGGVVFLCLVAVGVRLQSRFSERALVSAYSRVTGAALAVDVFVGNSNSQGWIFMRVKGYYGNGPVWISKRRDCCVLFVIHL